MRPIFKRSNSTKDKEDEDTDTPPGSRRGSWLSSKSSSRIEVSKVGEGELQEADSSSAGNDNKEEVQKRWKRVLYYIPHDLSMPKLKTLTLNEERVSSRQPTN